MLKAGVAIADVTPKEPLHLAGYPIPEDRSGLTKHDPLYCSAFYLNNGSTEIVIVTLDLIFVTKYQTREIREEINRQTGIPKENITVGCTHTHSGPTTTASVFGAHREDQVMYPEYVAFMVDTIVSTSVEAVKNAFPATVGYSSVRCGKEKNIGGNRHDPAGPADDEVYAIGIKDESGKMRGIISSYSLHPTLLHAESYAYSADFPGYMRLFLEEAYPGSIFGFQMGTSGNQSTRHFRTGQTFEESKRYGDTLGAAVKEALEQATYSDDLVLKMETAWVEPILKDFPTAEEAAAEAAAVQKRYDDAKASGMPYPSLRTLEVTLIGANRMAKLTRQFLEPGVFDGLMAAFPFEVKALRIGDLAIVFSAGELFVEIGLAIKEKSPFEHTYVVSASNGITVGYVVTQKAFEERGYEALGTVLKPEMADKLVNEALAVLEKVKN